MNHQAEAAVPSSKSLRDLLKELPGSAGLTVSIGPYHHGELQLRMVEVHKWGYLHAMLDQTQPHGVTLRKLIDVVVPKVEMIRQCYSENTDSFSGPDLVKMMVLDGCFIIQFLHQLKAGAVQTESPLKNVYVIASVMRDLLRLENQVPYFVLEDLFRTTNVPWRPWSLADLASHLFKFFPKVSGNVRERQSNGNEAHLLDSFRLSLIPRDQQGIRQVDESSYSPLIGTASQLRRVGFGFKQMEASTILEIKFDRERRTIGIPKIAIDDDLNFILPNMVAFEQCHGGTDGYVTAYAVFMGCIIHTADDVQLLRERKVISNHGMSIEDVVRFFRYILKDTTLYVDQRYLKSHIEILKETRKYEWAYLCGAQLLNAFNDSPWSALLGLAVIVTLTGLIQTMYTMLQYYHTK